MVIMAKKTMAGIVDLSGNATRQERFAARPAPNNALDVASADETTAHTFAKAYSEVLHKGRVVMNDITGAYVVEGRVGTTGAIEVSV